MRATRYLLGSTKETEEEKNDTAPECGDLRPFSRRDARAGDDSGNISMYRFAHGWMWMIPLPRVS